jgi:predicted nuclease with TOPRIM domain
MVDRVYKNGLPELRKALEKLREDFANLGSKTDWTKLRIEPLLKHLESLEELLVSGEFSREFSRLTRGVELFHSDLVYFRTNVKGLKKILQSEKVTIKSRAGALA